MVLLNDIVPISLTGKAICCRTLLYLLEKHILETMETQVSRDVAEVEKAFEPQNNPELMGEDRSTQNHYGLGCWGRAFCIPRLTKLSVYLGSCALAWLTTSNPDKPIEFNPELWKNPSRTRCLPDICFSSIPRQAWAR